MKKKEWMLYALLVCFLAGFAWVAHVLSYGPVKVIRYVVLAVGVCYLAVRDMRSRVVPNRFLLLLLAVRCVLFLPELLLYPDYRMQFLLSAAEGALLGMAILAIGNVICRHGMGMGDIKLFGVIGFYVGPVTVVAAMFVSLCFAAVYSIVLLCRKRIGARDEIAFVPFVFAGLVTAGLLGA